MKRENYISRDEYFMGIALLSAQRSKDPSTQVWACIVNSDKRIVWIWYNGFPTWIGDDDLPWGKSENFIETKYSYVVHAEANALLNTNRNTTQWATVYVTLFPCNECTKLLIQAGIKEIIYLAEKWDKAYEIASKKMLGLAGIHTRKYEEDIDLHLYYKH